MVQGAIPGLERAAASTYLPAFGLIAADLFLIPGIVVPNCFSAMFFLFCGER